MNICKALGTGSVFFFIFLALLGSSSDAKGILEILRDKGVITEDEYRQAIEEAKGNDAKVVEEASAEAKKQSKLPGWLDRVSFFGDLRYRHEGFYHSEIQTNNPTRNRERIRVRLGMDLPVNDELSGRVRIVSGDPNDPISTNQTLTDLFTRKPISLDWAYLTLSPWQTFGLDKLTGLEKSPIAILAGKQPIPMFVPGRSELVLDSDLSPEGVSETFTLWDRPDGFFRNFKITGLQWSIKEISNKSPTQLFNSGDAWMFGGQAQLQVAPTTDSRLTMALGNYGFQRLDVMARERNQNSSLVVTNNVRRFNGTIAGGSPVSPVSCAAPFTAPGCIAGFEGGFNILTVGAQLDLPTPWKDFPVSVFTDFAHNTQAATSHNNGYWLGFGIGQVRNKGDLRFTYTWARTETDAVPSVFSYSDFGRNGGTNVTGHFLALDYALFPRLVLTVKNHFVNFIDRPVGFHNPTQFRLQVDTVLSW